MSNAILKGADMGCASMGPVTRHRMRPCRPGRELQVAFAADGECMPLVGLAIAVVSSIGLWGALAAIVL